MSSIIEYSAEGPALKPLLLIDNSASGPEPRKELRLLSDGYLAFERSLSTLHDVLPGAGTIYIASQKESQIEAITTRLNQPDSIKNTNPRVDLEHGQDHEPSQFPEIVPIINAEGKDYGPATALLVAHFKSPDTTWLVLSCDFPVLPPAALQQLILEFKSPVTCFLNSEGVVEPLIGIWTPEALKKLTQEVEAGNHDLVNIVRDLGGQTVAPLREDWIIRTEAHEIYELSI